jgi:hypothetical protein
VLESPRRAPAPTLHEVRRPGSRSPTAARQVGTGHVPCEGRGGSLQRLSARPSVCLFAPFRLCVTKPALAVCFHPPFCFDALACYPFSASTSLPPRSFSPALLLGDQGLAHGDRHIQRTCGLVAMMSASHAEGRQFDPGQVYLHGVQEVICYFGLRARPRQLPRPSWDAVVDNGQASAEICLPTSELPEQARRQARQRRIGLPGLSPQQVGCRSGGPKTQRCGSGRSQNHLSKLPLDSGGAFQAGATVKPALAKANQNVAGMLLPTANMTVWPSGLRRWLKAPFRKGVGSNPTAVMCAWRRPCALGSRFEASGTRANSFGSGERAPRARAPARAFDRPAPKRNAPCLASVCRHLRAVQAELVPRSRRRG